MYTSLNILLFDFQIVLSYKNSKKNSLLRIMQFFFLYEITEKNKN